MVLEIVDFPIKNGDFPVRYVNVYQRVTFQNIQAEEAFQRYHGLIWNHHLGVDWMDWVIGYPKSRKITRPLMNSVQKYHYPILSYPFPLHDTG